MSCPVLIRGKHYPSQAAAARALGVSPATVFQALNTGTIDHVGLRSGKQPRIFILDRDKTPMSIKDFLKARPDINERGFRCQVSLARKDGYRVMKYRREIFMFKVLGD